MFPPGSVRSSSNMTQIVLSVPLVKFWQSATTDIGLVADAKVSTFWNLPCCL